MQRDLVDFKDPLVMKCNKCQSIVVDALLIDELVSCDHQKLIMLYAGLKSSSITQVLIAQPIQLCDHLARIYVYPLQCSECRQRIGIAPCSVNVNCTFLQNRLLLSAKHLKISDNQSAETIFDLLKDSQDNSCADQLHQETIPAKHPGPVKGLENQPSQLVITHKGKVSTKMTLEDFCDQAKTELIKQVEKDKQSTKALAQILQSLQYYGNFLERLEKRVVELAPVCELMYQRVIQAIPELHKI